MKVIAETIGNIELMDSVHRDVLPWDRPAIITWSNFWESRTGKGQIKVIQPNLPDAASDEEFQDYLREAENVDLAVASFVSKFEEPKPKPPPQKRTPKSKAAPKTEE